MEALEAESPTSGRAQGQEPGRLRALHLVCAALAASVAIDAGLCWALVELVGVRLPVPALPGLPLSLTAAATFLILLASRLRTGLLRRTGAPLAAPGLAPAFLAYQRATIVSFALLEAAAVLGLALTLVTGNVSYGVVFCAASLIAMLVRWPRSGEVDRLARRRGLPPGPDG